MSVQKISLLGNPGLYNISEEVTAEELNDIKKTVQDSFALRSEEKFIRI